MIVINAKAMFSRLRQVVFSMDRFIAQHSSFALAKIPRQFIRQEPLFNLCIMARPHKVVQIGLQSFNGGWGQPPSRGSVDRGLEGGRPRPPDYRREYDDRNGITTTGVG
jgi:hypothetical protein